MKKGRAWSEILMILVFTTFCFSASYAEDLTIWSGKWFKLAEKISGQIVDESGGIRSLRYSQTIYIHIYEVDQSNGVLRCRSYDLRDGQLEFTGPIDIRVLAGNSLDFLWWTQMGPEVQELISGGLAGRIQGKMKNGALSATLKTVGGSGAAITDEGSVVAGINWSGSLVLESKVPPEQ